MIKPQPSKSVAITFGENPYSKEPSLPVTGVKATRRLRQKMTAQIQIVTDFRVIDLWFIISSILCRQVQSSPLGAAGGAATEDHTAGGFRAKRRAMRRHGEAERGKRRKAGLASGLPL
jgi:hypothetical protein